MQVNVPSPVEKVFHPLLKENGVSLYVKREDKIHPLLSGNKWRKLKYNLKQIMERDDCKGVITFGGAFSNHIYSFAHACRLYQIKGVAIIRGDQMDKENPTLQAVKAAGVDMHFVSREEYRSRGDINYWDKWKQIYPGFNIVPEGGSNDLALKGLKELAVEISEQGFNDHRIAVAFGTGCTASGIVKYLRQNGENIVEVYPALKGGFVEKSIRQWVNNDKKMKSVHIVSDYHFGGYAKVKPPLVEFINDFYTITSIPLDPIYNGKLVYGLMDRVAKGYYSRGSKLLWVHTGGLQGVVGFNYRWKGKYHLIFEEEVRK